MILGKPCSISKGKTRGVVYSLCNTYMLLATFSIALPEEAIEESNRVNQVS